MQINLCNYFFPFRLLQEPTVAYTELRVLTIPFLQINRITLTTQTQNSSREFFRENLKRKRSTMFVAGDVIFSLCIQYRKVFKESNNLIQNF